MGSWSSQSDRRRVLLFLTHHPGMKLDDIATGVGVSGHSAHAIVTDLTATGYVSNHKVGRRDRYQIVAREPLPTPMSREKTFREVIVLFTGTGVPPAQGEPR